MGLAVGIRIEVNFVDSLFVKQKQISQFNTLSQSCLASCAHVHMRWVGVALARTSLINSASCDAVSPKVRPSPGSLRRLAAAHNRDLESLVK